MINLPQFDKKPQTIDFLGLFHFLKVYSDQQVL
jgi:hypothetical protein